MAEIRTADRGDIRDINLLAVIQAMRRLGATTRAEIARETGLSAPTVSAVIGVLVEAGLVGISGVGPATGGRRGSLIGLRSRSRIVMAVDLSSVPRRCALVDLHHAVIEGSIIDIPETRLRSPQRFAQWIGEQVRAQQGVIGVAVAVPGVTDPVAGVIEWAPGLGWRSVPLQKEIQTAAPGLLVVVENDLNLAALGEYALAGGGMTDLVMLGLRGGLGAGVILRGTLHRGVHFAAGEIGYLPVLRGARGSRDFGALEATLFAHLQGHSDPASSGTEFRPPINRPKPLAGAAEVELVELLAAGCLAIAAVLDVAAIILSDEIAQLAVSLDIEIADRLAAALPHPPHLMRTKLGVHGTLQGGAVAVHQQLAQDVRRLLT